MPKVRYQTVGGRNAAARSNLLYGVNHHQAGQNTFRYTKLQTNTLQNILMFKNHALLQIKFAASTRR